MPWIPDAPEAIAARLAAAWEAEFQHEVPDGVDASTAVAPWSALARSPAQALYGTQLGFAAEVRDFWLDACDEDLVPEQAARLGLSQAVAQRSGGNANPPAGSTVGTVIPVNATLGGGRYRVTGARTVDGTGTEVVPILAVTAGVAGDVAAGTVLAFDSPIAGLAAQQLTVDADGISGGSEQETMEELRQRAIAWRRRRPKGGGPGDYISWTQAIYPKAIVKELPLWAGLGRVGVVVGMAPGRAATSTELSRIGTALRAQAPLDVADLTAMSAVIVPFDLTLAVDPDSTAVRAAVQAALATFLAAEPGIGGTVDLSRLWEAISSAAGEYRHRIIAPAADVVGTTRQLFVPGTITWVAWP
ncbi:baseplate J/gp47 family protein [Roseomonas sp. HJA6]|uniref:Baseplate J/gp47 family protein n=1 Tax=Roseomonas alba TaxID=2846776 RepID=A0ABS7AI81_9PROT|nr:baseplate J/gp47 family protein [Neoroseomonas alba]MBW6402025.1 baseplate J/gp47 family protein [Neoroseomonas alba]